MMVTFISQCEKNALKKTRRVLDAFANRIGDNTWQTVITEAGLNTVKKMLRQTASKSTAVSCHWIRSRSRSQFLWVVGNKSKFDEQGVVPVNYTSNQIIIGDIEIMADQIYANTKGQRLDQHLFAVGYIAYQIVKRLVPQDNNLAIAVFIAGCWHDIGKIDPVFQDWLSKLLNKKNFEDVPDDGQHIDKKTGKFSWQKHPRHNEISLLLFHLLFNAEGINQDSHARSKHALYWHHAKPLRDRINEIKRMIGVFNKLENLEQSYPKLTASVEAILKSIKDIADGYLDNMPAEIDRLNIPKFDNIEDALEQVDLPKYKSYSAKESIDKYRNLIKHNALNNLARSALITADRLVSKSFTGVSLNEHINNHLLAEILDQAFQKDRGLKQHIRQCLDGFNQTNPDTERNRQQAKAAKDLSDKDVTIGVLKGPAGCGKTKIALEWALNTEVKKMFWVCPRVQICEGLFKDLQGKEYLPNSKLEICTGEIKQTLDSGKLVDTPEGSEFSGDIVITTIDQIVNSITTHRNVTTLVDFMNSHVVFDEYHEYINMPAFNLLFAELVECKKYQQNEDNTSPNTLLVSATPNPLFVTKFLQLPERDMVGIDSFNNSQYQIEFIEFDEKNEDAGNPLFQEQSANTFVISNTAITAQKSFIDNQEKENGILLHSKFKKSDREDLFEKVFNAFKKNGTKNYDLLRSGPVVQASLNITCDKMISEMTHAENFLQRMGRLDRFGQNKPVNQYVIAITSAVKNGSSRDSSSRFLNSLKSLQSSKAWFDFLQNELPENAVTISQIYDLYDRFYQDENYCRLVEQDLVAALKDSVIRIELELIDPVTLPSYKKEENKIKIKKHSLRGDNRFVQMAVCSVINRNDHTFTGEYAYSEEHSEESLTYGVDVICGHGIAEQDLLAFMAKKHHNIKQVIKAYNDSQLLNEARNPETPIYLSYTPADLKKVEAQPNSYAIYYAIGTHQPIGAISLKQLNSKGD
ncbi:MAG: CRISPR-associated helicase Cas3' [Deltaproteobacteria bacterium]|nr:CRISPR-associated helicase Cas3' [Deltaproteobacteria bacterium]